MDYCYVVEFGDYDGGGVHYAGRDIHKALKIMTESQATLREGSTGGFDTSLYVDGEYVRSVRTLADAYKEEE